jgi:hypothetical protein
MHYGIKTKDPRDIDLTRRLLEGNGVLNELEQRRVAILMVRISFIFLFTVNIMAQTTSSVLLF